MKRFLLIGVLASACTIPAGGPATLDDTASTFSGEAIAAPVLSNDWPETGLALTGATVPGGEGVAAIEGDMVVYDPGGFAGTAQVLYTVEHQGQSATGMLLVNVGSPDVDIDVPDSFGDVPVFAEGRLRGAVSSSAGRVPVQIAASPGLAVDQSGCSEVSAGGRCEFVVMWSPDTLGAHEFEIDVNGMTFPITGSATQGIEAPPEVAFETVEGSDWSDVVRVGNLSESVLAVDVSSSTDLLTVRSCASVGPGEFCDITMALTADRMPPGGEVVSGQLVIAYGPDGPAIELPVPFEVVINEMPLAAPTLLFPLQSTVWIGEFVAPVTFEWEGEPGPEGWLLEVFLCSEPDECRLLESVPTFSTSLALDLGAVADFSSTTTLVRPVPAPGFLRWEVSALGPNGRRETTPSGPLEIVPSVIDASVEFIPASGVVGDATRIASFRGETIEFEIMYRSNLLLPRSYELSILHQPLVGFEDYATEGVEPANGTLVADGEGVIQGSLDVPHGSMSSVRMSIAHPACPTPWCAVWETDAHFLFVGIG